MGRIFLSYRRADSAGHAGRLAADLRRELGAESVFFDRDDIAPGKAWRSVLRTEVANSSVVLVLISRSWLEPGSDGIPRLALLDDVVRAEIATAFELDRDVIPVLFDNATMPAANLLPSELVQLPDRHAACITSERWDFDVGRLVGSIQGGDQYRPLISRLRSALYEPTSSQRLSALETLAELDHPDAMRAMQLALGHPLDEVRVSVALLLGQRGDVAAIPTLIRSDVVADPKSFAALVALGPRAIEPLLLALDIDQSIDLSVRKVLRSMRDDVSADAALLALPHLATDQAQGACLDALGWIGSPKALSALRRWALDERERPQREAAILSLGMLRDAQSETLLLDKLVDQPWNVQQTAVAALYLLDTETSRRAIWEREERTLANYRSAGNDEAAERAEAWYLHYGLYNDHDERKALAAARPLLGK